MLLCVCCHCYMIACVNLHVYMSIRKYVYEMERVCVCVHGFGSLKIKISQSISDVFMFSSYICIFVNIYILMSSSTTSYSFFISSTVSLLHVYSHRRFFLSLSHLNAYIICVQMCFVEIGF